MLRGLVANDRNKDYRRAVRSGERAARNPRVREQWHFFARGAQGVPVSGTSPGLPQLFVVGVRADNPEVEGASIRARAPMRQLGRDTRPDALVVTEQDGGR